MVPTLIWDDFPEEKVMKASMGPEDRWPLAEDAEEARMAFGICMCGGCARCLLDQGYSWEEVYGPAPEEEPDEYEVWERHMEEDYYEAMAEFEEGRLRYLKTLWGEQHVTRYFALDA